MKKLFIAAFATFAMVSISSVFANKAMIENVPEGLANDTTDTTSTSAPAEPSTSTAEPSTSTAEPATSTSEPSTGTVEPATQGNGAGDGMYLMDPVDTTKTDTTVAK